MSENVLEIKGLLHRSTEKIGANQGAFIKLILHYEFLYLISKTSDLETVLLQAHA